MAEVVKQVIKKFKTRFIVGHEFAPYITEASKGYRYPAPGSQPPGVFRGKSEEEEYGLHYYNRKPKSTAGYLENGHPDHLPSLHFNKADYQFMEDHYRATGGVPMFGVYPDREFMKQHYSPCPDSDRDRSYFKDTLADFSEVPPAEVLVGK